MDFRPLARVRGLSHSWDCPTHGKPILEREGLILSPLPDVATDFTTPDNDPVGIAEGDARLGPAGVGDSAELTGRGSLTLKWLPIQRVEGTFEYRGTGSSTCGGYGAPAPGGQGIRKRASFERATCSPNLALCRA